MDKKALGEPDRRAGQVPLGHAILTRHGCGGSWILPQAKKEDLAYTCGVGAWCEKRELEVCLGAKDDVWDA